MAMLASYPGSWWARQSRAWVRGYGNGGFAENFSSILNYGYVPQPYLRTGNEATYARAH